MEFVGPKQIPAQQIPFAAATELSRQIPNAIGSIPARDWFVPQTKSKCNLFGPQTNAVGISKVPKQIRA